MITRRTALTGLLAAGATMPRSLTARELEPAPPAAPGPPDPPADTDFYSGYLTFRDGLGGYFEHHFAGHVHIQRDPADGRWIIEPVLDLQHGLDRAARLDRETFEAGVRIGPGYERRIAFNGVVEADANAGQEA